MKSECQISGEGMILLSCFIWAFFPVISKMGYNYVPPILSAAIIHAIIFVFYGVYICIKGQVKILADFSASQWRDIILGSFLVGPVFYALIFYALAHTSAGNASLFFLFEVLWTYIILNAIIRSEPWDAQHIIGAIFMFCGAGIILIPGFNGQIQWGDVILFFATMVPPTANFFIKRAMLNGAPVTMLLTIRGAMGGICLAGLAMTIESIPQWGAIYDALPLLLINGIVIFAISKLLWMGGMARIPITKALSLTMYSPAITLIAAWVFLAETPNIWQITALFPICCGMWFLIRPSGINKPAAQN